MGVRKKTRLIITIIYVVLFLIATPSIVLYSLGYRIDFEGRKIISTGGIYVRVLPSGADIIINSVKSKTGFFSNSVFVQNLSPKTHEVLIKKEGYYDYKKELLVKENEVTKLENVILFKKNIVFELLGEDIDYFSIAPDNNVLLVVKIEKNKINFEVTNLTNEQKQSFSLVLPKKEVKTTTLDLKWSDDSNKALLNAGNSYFLLESALQTPKITALSILANSKEVSFNPQDSSQIFFIKGKNLYSDKQNTPILKNVVAYQLINQNITWLSEDGFLYTSDNLGQTKNKLSSKVFPIKKDSEYKIVIFSEAIFLKENQSLFLFNKKSNIFENFYDNVKDLKLSLDGQKLIYFSDNEVLYSILGHETESILLKKSSEETTDGYWLNNDYIVSADKKNEISISEIDARGNINTVNLPQTIFISDEKNIDVKNPKIFFNQSDKKLYILTNGSLLASEGLIP